MIAPSRLFALCLAGLLAGCSPAEQTLTVFEDVTTPSGLGDYVGMTFGAAWGDFDGDGLPDLYLPNHLSPEGAKLFRNLGQGRFEDVTRQWFAPDDLGGDKHGAAWADLNNNGRLDLIQLTGAKSGVGTEPKRLFLNHGDRFEEVAEEFGVMNPEGRTRMPLWLDLDGDGRLDLIQGADTRFDDLEPPFTFLQQNNRFQQTLEALRFRSRSVPFCIVTELINDGHPELVCRVAGKNLTAQVFSTAALPARELDLLPVTAFEDVAAGDFDNDGFIDLFLARKNPAGPVALGRPDGNALVADLRLDPTDVAKPAGFSFRAGGELHFTIVGQPRDAIAPTDIRIGQQGGSPPGLQFTLSAATAGVAGRVPDQPAARGQVRIGFEQPDRWTVVATGPAASPADAPPRAPQLQLQIGVRAAEPVRDPRALGDLARAEEAPQRLFMNRGGRLVEESDRRGVNRTPISAVNVVAADFNNDMHLDLFVLGSGEVGDQPNLLLLNRGNGHFEVVAAAGGAGGPQAGVGDSVTTVDFDGDGFIDLLIATGGSMGRGYGLPADAGGYRLYRNAGNDHHWLHLDLEGAASNRDGIGARVFLTAGGVTQTRVQDGGVHHRGQNHSRLHFGLAKNPQADLIRVQWPSGKVQELREVAANQILRIREAP